MFTDASQHRRHLLYGLLLLLTASSLWLAAIWITTQRSLRPIRQPLPQDPYVQAYFNQSQASVYTDSYRNIERHGDDLEQVITTAIDQANASVEIAVQAFELPLIAQALVRAAQRGITVRLALENEYANEPNEAIAALRSTGIPIIDDTADGSKGSGLMHHKFIVIDGRWVITGTANFTYSGIHGDLIEPTSRGNANALLKIDSTAIAAQFLSEFNQLWGDGPAGKSDSKFGIHKRTFEAQRTQLPTGPITLQFSPTSATRPWESSTSGLIARQLSQSQRSIDLALFVFSDQRIANQIQAQTTKGIRIRTLVESTFIYRNYSEALDMLGIALPSHRCKIEQGNQPWPSPISTVGFPQLPPGDKLHHKFAILDNKAVIIGSHNWSQAANTQNDEALLIIENATVAAHFQREFERLYEQAEEGHTPKLRREIQKAEQRCR